MTAEANIGNDFRFQVGDGAGSENFSDICAALNFGEFGEEKTLLDITTLCSSAREYRNGLADGLEIPLELNFKDGEQRARDLYQDYKANRTRNFRIVVIGGSPTETFAFAATIRGWKVKAPVGDKSGITFQLKISGAVTWSY
jgi:hypothetical protein